MREYEERREHPLDLECSLVAHPGVSRRSRVILERLYLDLEEVAEILSRLSAFPGGRIEFE